MKQISIVTPVHNEEQFINGLLESIEKVQYPKENYEIIVISDGSTDHTVEVVKQHSQVRLIELPEKTGRYQARKKGAEAACFPHILFVDARVFVDPLILSALNRIDARAVNPYSLGREKPNHFEVFYGAIRKLVFYRFYQSYGEPVSITKENFDTMPKGMTAFYVEKDILFRAYEALASEDMGKVASDDTKLIRAIIDHVPVLLHPDVKILSFARTSFIKSILHLDERAPRFVDYYFNPALSKFWLVIVFPLLVLFAILAALIFIPVSGWVKLAGLVGLDLVLTALLARSFRDFLIISYMLPLCTAVFYNGVIRGIFIKVSKLLQKK
jgi:glycosyltransferase involved in cell wall biosynthesis